MNGWNPKLMEPDRALVLSQAMPTKYVNGQTAFSHQIEDAVQMAVAGRTIQASEMGTGKTRSALRAAKIVKVVTGLPIVVFCPPGVMFQWESEAAIVDVVINTFSWGKLPEVIEDWPCILILDECHKIGNITTKRTKRVLEWSKQAVALWGISGTPTVNGRPRELFPLLKALGHPIAEDRQAFEAKFCNAHWRVLAGGTTYDGRVLEWNCKVCRRHVGIQSHWRTPVGKVMKCPTTECTGTKKWPRVWWDTDGANNLDELNEALKPVLIRRTKAECLDLPQKLRKFIEWEPTAEERQKYKALEDPACASSTDGAEAITTLMALRVLTSTMKVPHAIALAKELNEQGHQCILFTEFVETARAIAEGLRTKPYEGATTAPKREAIVKDFLDGKKKNFVGTSKAGGEGLNLVAADYVILVDRPWTMALAEQCEDRAHRQGQRWPVTVIWPRMCPVDSAVDEVLLTKQEATGAILGGPCATSEERWALDVINTLLCIDDDED